MGTRQTDGTSLSTPAFRAAAISGNIGNSIQIAITSGIVFAATVQWGEFFQLGINQLVNYDQANTYYQTTGNTPLTGFLSALVTTVAGAGLAFVFNRINLSWLAVPIERV